jgi:hypothetical protein
MNMVRALRMGGRAKAPWERKKGGRWATVALTLLMGWSSWELGVLSWHQFSSPQGAAAAGALAGSVEYFAACQKKASQVVELNRDVSAQAMERHAAARAQCVMGFDPALLDKNKAPDYVDALAGSGPVRWALNALSAVSWGSREEGMQKAALDDPMSHSPMGSLLRLTTLQVRQLAALGAGDAQAAAREGVRAQGVLEQGLALAAAEQARARQAESKMPLMMWMVKMAHGSEELLSSQPAIMKQSLLKAHWKIQHPERVLAAQKMLAQQGSAKGLEKVQEEAAAWALSKA